VVSGVGRPDGLSLPEREGLDDGKGESSDGGMNKEKPKDGFSGASRESMGDIPWDRGGVVADVVSNAPRRGGVGVELGKARALSVMIKPGNGSAAAESQTFADRKTDGSGSSGGTQA
jgi:hypothetical protein